MRLMAFGGCLVDPPPCGPFALPSRLMPLTPGAHVEAYTRKPSPASLLQPRVLPLQRGAGTLKRGVPIARVRAAATSPDFGIPGHPYTSSYTPSGASPCEARTRLSLARARAFLGRNVPDPRPQRCNTREDATPQGV
jgi:hypothetical protein